MDKSLRKTSMILLVLLILPLWCPSFLPKAEAGAWNRVKSFFQLPGEVDQLKDKYQEVQQNYEEVQQNFQDTREQLDATRQQAEKYQEEQLKLLEDNKRLEEQNRKLQETVGKLEHSEEERSQGYKKIRRILYTAAGLVVGYFVLGRLLRVVWRSRI